MERTLFKDTHPQIYLLLFLLSTGDQEMVGRMNGWLGGWRGGWVGGCSVAMEQNLRSSHTHFIRVIEINPINYAP